MKALSVDEKITLLKMGEECREKRKELNLSIKEVSAYTKLSIFQITNFESGRSNNAYIYYLLIKFYNSSVI